ncbi:MAG: putative ABC transporter permease [Ruminococcus flavefaciens]|nr:putative ABC transporter permease [Ruminococcus flavefaciens]MCM1058681.1 putative ABC transporter permease [Eubacterium sp.]
MAEKKKRITYQKLFWLFMVGSVLGVLIEGLYCLYHRGRWETHVVSVWGPFCIIYGLGAAGLYVGAVLMEKKTIITKFVMFSLIATVIEYLCGAFLKYVLGMKAWTYSSKPFNFDGIICLEMTIAWGILGILFSTFALGSLEKVFDKMTSKTWKILCACLSVFMAINLLLTALAIARWSGRHYRIEPQNWIETKIDTIYPDTVMKERFVEWRFINK